MFLPAFGGWRPVGDLCALDSLRSYFKRPCEDECDWKCDCDQRDHKAHDPIWNLQKWKDLSRNLNQEPSNNRVCDRHLVNVASLQLGKEIAIGHSIIC